MCFYAPPPTTTPFFGPAAATTVVDATVEVYDLLFAEMRPTPSRSHYTFNMRDLSKVCASMCAVQSVCVGGACGRMCVCVCMCSYMVEPHYLKDLCLQGFNWPRTGSTSPSTMDDMLPRFMCPSFSQQKFFQNFQISQGFS